MCKKKQISNFESFSNFSPINFRITIFNYFIFFFIFFNEQLFLNIGNKLTNISQYKNIHFTFIKYPQSIRKFPNFQLIIRNIYLLFYIYIFVYLF